MFQRSTLYDDARGVGENLDERNVHDKKRGIATIFKHWVRTFKDSDSVDDDRLFRKSLDQQPMVMFSQQKTVENAPKRNIPGFSLKSLGLSDNIKVQLQPTQDQHVVRLRIQNILDPYWSVPKTETINISSLAQAMYGDRVSSLELRTLNSVYLEEDLEQRYVWQGEDYTNSPYVAQKNVDALILEPGQIKTVNIYLKTSSEEGTVSE